MERWYMLACFYTYKKYRLFDQDPWRRRGISCYECIEGDGGRMSAIPEVLVREHKSRMQGTTRIPSKIAARACKNKKAKF